MRQFFRFWLSVLMILYALVACSLGDSEPRIVYITATPPMVAPIQPTMAVPQVIPTNVPSVVQPPSSVSPVPMALNITPTPNPPRFDLPSRETQQHIVVAGDNLSKIAERYGTTLASILAVNELDNPNILSIGQVIHLPELPTEFTPAFKMLPDVRLVRGVDSNQFDVAGFIAEHGGYLRLVTDEVESRLADGSTTKTRLTATQVVERVSVEYSVDPRLLLALLEYRAGWLSNVNPTELQKTFPLSLTLEPGRIGLYRQLSWAAYHLNAGYYGWKYRGLTTLEFSDGERFLYDEGLNAGTVALQYFFSLRSDINGWRRAIGTPQGFFATYYAYFGNPFDATDPIIPRNLVQPDLGLPFASGEVWFFTGGAHGGWASSSAWSALDFAPPDERNDGVFCFVSNYWVRAVADGIIARSQDGGVWLDLDGDGDDSTGWVIFYLHIATQDRVAVGTRVRRGDPIGRASCEGGFSTATHLHISRKYNGEWIPTDCPLCSPHDSRPVFNLGGWQVVSIPNQEYQGYLDRNGERLTAAQGRLSPINRISW